MVAVEVATSEVKVAVTTSGGSGWSGAFWVVRTELKDAVETRRSQRPVTASD